MDWQPRVQDFVRPHGSLTGDGSIEESLLGLPDLRLLPLLDVVLVNLKVHPLNLLRGLDLDAAQEGLKEVEDSSGRFQEFCQTWITRHVLGQVGEEDSHVERDLLGRVQEATQEGGVLDVALVVRLATLKQEINLFTVKR